MQILHLFLVLELIKYKLNKEIKKKVEWEICNVSLCLNK